MNRWERRIERAQVLEQEYPAAAEFLHFYREIAKFQQRLAARIAPEDYFDPEHLREMPAAAELLALLERVAPVELAQTAMLLGDLGYWNPGDPAVVFLNRVVAQPYAEKSAQFAYIGEQHTTSVCPACGERPVAAVLRPEGEGGKRSLVCSLCFTEWDFRRLLCPRCGEEDQHKLPVYSAEPFPHIQIEACDTCHTYVKRIDMTKNGLAVPEVDELAAVPLDLWAAEHDYSKLQANLFGL